MLPLDAITPRSDARHDARPVETERRDAHPHRAGRAGSSWWVPGRPGMSKTTSASASSASSSGSSGREHLHGLAGVPCARDVAAQHVAFRWDHARHGCAEVAEHPSRARRGITAEIDDAQAFEKMFGHWRQCRSEFGAAAARRSGTASRSQVIARTPIRARPLLQPCATAGGDRCRRVVSTTPAGYRDGNGGDRAIDEADVEREQPDDEDPKDRQVLEAVHGPTRVERDHGYDHAARGSEHGAGDRDAQRRRIVRLGPHRPTPTPHGVIVPRRRCVVKRTLGQIN